MVKFLIKIGLWFVFVLLVPISHKGKNKLSNQLVLFFCSVLRRQYTTGMDFFDKFGDLVLVMYYCTINFDFVG